MSDAQLAMLYDITRTSEGYPKFPEIDRGGPVLSAREYFNRRCYLLGINEPSIRQAKWEALVAASKTPQAAT